MSISVPRIGIIGIGFVGGAIKKAYSWRADTTLVLMDTDPKRGTASYEDIMTCDVVFVCVPSPSNADGTCNTAILESVLDNLVNYKGVIISKSTVPPGVYAKLGAKFPNLVHAPEFLTAANANTDYSTGTFAIVGGSDTVAIDTATAIIKLGQTRLRNVFRCTLEEAALAKYAINTFLSTKVIFMNEFAELAKSFNANYSHIAAMISADTRIGSSHLQVPGPDGAHGFGGACFPKDTAALLEIAKQQEVSLSVLQSAVTKNKQIRPVEPK